MGSESTLYTQEPTVLQPPPEYTERNQHCQATNSAMSSTQGYMGYPSLTSEYSSEASIDSLFGYYDDSYMQDPISTFGTDVERVGRHNSIFLPEPVTYETQVGRSNNTLSPLPIQFQKQINTMQSFIPFKPLLMVANSRNLTDGFPMVYFPEQFDSHDISPTDWQRFLSDLKLISINNTKPRGNHPTYSGRGESMSRTFDDRLRGRRGTLSSLSSALGDHVSGNNNSLRDDGLVSLVLKVGVSVIDSRKNRKDQKKQEKYDRKQSKRQRGGFIRSAISETMAATTQPNYGLSCQSNKGSSNQMGYRSVCVEDNIIELIERWNTMFFNSRSVNVYIKFPLDVKQDYQYAINQPFPIDSERARLQVQMDGAGSLDKCRLIIKSL